jgi:hypothetical protein
LIACTQIAWDDSAGDFDWRTTTAIPHQLAGWLSAEPKFLDLRWCAGREREQLRGGKWQNAIADLSSVLQDKPKDELYGEDARQRRTQRLIVGTSIAALVTAPRPPLPHRETNYSTMPDSPDVHKIIPSQLDACHIFSI